jgi:hypothetical protein
MLLRARESVQKRFYLHIRKKVAVWLSTGTEIHSLLAGVDGTTKVESGCSSGDLCQLRVVHSIVAVEKIDFET